MQLQLTNSLSYAANSTRAYPSSPAKLVAHTVRSTPRYERPAEVHRLHCVARNSSENASHTFVTGDTEVGTVGGHIT